MDLKNQRTRPCAQPGCVEYARDGKSYCPKHAQTNEQTQTQKEYDAARYDSPHRRLYALAAWKGGNGLRLFTLQRDPICTECNVEPSTVADHIIDHKGDHRLFFDRKNVRGVCKECHDRKTARDYLFQR